MSKLAKLCVAGLVTGSMLAVASGAAAEGLDVGPDGEESLPVGMAPLGFRHANVVLFPRLDASVTYTDNVFRTRHNRKDDWIFQAGTVAPSILLRSDLPLHEYFLEGRLIAPLHTRSSSDSRVGVSVGGGGRLDLTPTSALSGSASYTLTHEERGAPDLPFEAKEPTQVQIFRVAPRYDHRFQRVAFRVSGQFLRFDYRDTPRIATNQTNPASIRSSLRDRNEWSGNLRVSYALTPLSSAFVETGVSRRIYDTTNGPAGFNRNSDGYEALVGIATEVSPTMRGEVAGGVGHRSYDDSRLGNTTGLRARGNLLWDVGPLTRMRGGLSVSHEETVLANSSGSLTSSLNLGLDHQVFRNTLAKVGGYYRMRDYKGISRDDHEFGGTLGMSYWVSQMLSVGAEYGHHRRTSSGAQRGEPFYENRVTVGLTLRR